MPINPIAASLLLYLELPYSALIRLNEQFPDFLNSSLTRTGYSTLHLLPELCEDAFEEFNSWPKEGRDLVYFQMTQRRKAVPVKVIEDTLDEEIHLEKGVVSVLKFETVNAFMNRAERLSQTSDCCFTVLLVINQVPTEGPSVLAECRQFIKFQESLRLKPSALINCPSPSWSRFAFSFSRGSEGEFRIAPAAYSSQRGLFDLSHWRAFPGGITQLYSLKAELSYVLGITGNYGD